MSFLLSKRHLGIAVVVLRMACLPYWASRYWVLVALLSPSTSPGQMWNLLAGYSGLISWASRPLSVWGLLPGGLFHVLRVSHLVEHPHRRNHLRFVRAPYFRTDSQNARGLLAIGSWTVAETLRILFSN